MQTEQVGSNCYPLKRRLQISYGSMYKASQLRLRESSWYRVLFI